MTTSSSELSGGLVLDGAVADVRSLPTHELRSGTWTRLGASTVLGDTVTEHTLAGLVDEARSAARAQGYSTGWSEGRKAAEVQAAETARELAAQHAEAEARREAEHRTAVDALVRAAASFDQALAAACARVESQAVELAMTLTEELLGRELAVAAAPGADAVRRALALLPGEPVARIRVSAAEAGCAELREVAGTVTVMVDPSLHRGDVVVETSEAVLDARVSGAVARVREALLP